MYQPRFNRNATSEPRRACLLPPSRAGHFANAPSIMINNRPSAIFAKAKGSGPNQLPAATAPWWSESSRMTS